MPSSEYAVQTLYSNHHGWLNTWLRSRLGNAADAADLAQDTFVRLLQKTERFELKAPRAFLRTIARGLVIVAKKSSAPTWSPSRICPKPWRRVLKNVR